MGKLTDRLAKEEAQRKAAAARLQKQPKLPEDPKAKAKAKPLTKEEFTS
jgi:hypothetical protein